MSSGGQPTVLIQPPGFFAAFAVGAGEGGPNLPLQRPNNQSPNMAALPILEPRKFGPSGGGTVTPLSCELEQPTGGQIQENKSCLKSAVAGVAEASKNYNRPSLLHEACRQYASDADMIIVALQSDPSTAQAKAPPLPPSDDEMEGDKPDAKRKASCFTTGFCCPKKRKKAFSSKSYPLNIAIRSGATEEVVKVLVSAAPEVLSKHDDEAENSPGRTPLSVAIACGADLGVISTLLSLNPSSASIPDRRRNYPLHLLCARNLLGRNDKKEKKEKLMEFMERLVDAYPEALQKRNFHGRIPLDIAQELGLCEDTVGDYLQSAMYKMWKSGGESLTI